ncbi:MAG: WYL domain-containing protein [Burkholderiales bacterium]|nr:WYL domain-containing protein [Burkholderiales bacterium]
MTKIARHYKIEMLIRQRGHVSFAEMLAELEVSRATLKRDLEYLRDQLGAPIEYDRDVNGYRFGAGYGGQRHELPGLWFSERELYSLLMAYQLLSGLDSEGLLSRHLQPLLDRIHELLGPGGENETRVLMRRVKIISALRRPVQGEFFERVGEALVRRRRLHMRYLTRGRGSTSDREVSPQRLVHYKNTWYLDAWCHTREKLLRFALDAVQHASVLEARAKDVAMKQVEAEMDTGYGIYAGGTRQWATLRFSPQAAPWISREEWHPEQRGRWLDDGSFELELPYVDETELLMDVLRQGEQARVVAPASLVQSVRRRLEAAAGQYLDAPVPR